MGKRDQLRLLCQEAEDFCCDLFSFNRTTLKLKYQNREEAILDKTQSLVQRAQVFLNRTELTKFHNKLDRFFAMRKPKNGDICVFYGRGDLTRDLENILDREVE